MKCAKLYASSCGLRSSDVESSDCIKSPDCMAGTIELPDCVACCGPLATFDDSSQQPNSALSQLAMTTASGDRDRKDQAKQVSRVLKQTYPDAECALHHESPFQLLAATILSAQCTDERVNKVTPALFEAFPTPVALAEASQGDVERYIQSCGFFRAKATNLRGMAQRVVSAYGGEIPQNLEELITLPGVGRKTANVVLGTSFGIASGVVVDTHVTRISTLLGLTCGKTAEAIERDLMALLPRKDWVDFSHRLIHHGRRLCIARRPKCGECPLLSLCNRTGLPPLV